MRGRYVEIHGRRSEWRLVELAVRATEVTAQSRDGAEQRHALAWLSSLPVDGTRTLEAERKPRANARITYVGGRHQMLLTLAWLALPWVVNVKVTWVLSPWDEE